MKKKLVAALLCVAMTASMLLGCSAGSEGGGSDDSSGSGSAGKNEMEVEGDATEIEVWTFIELHQQFYTDMAEKWNEEHPDKKVKLVLSNMAYVCVDSSNLLAVSHRKRRIVKLPGCFEG